MIFTVSGDEDTAVQLGGEWEFVSLHGSRTGQGWAFVRPAMTTYSEGCQRGALGQDIKYGVSVVIVVTLFPTKYMKTHTHTYIYIIHVYIFIYTYNTFTVVNTQNVHMYCVSACQKKAEAYWAGCRIIHKEPYRIYPIEYEHDFNMLFCCGFCWLSVIDGSTWLIYLYSLGCFPIRRIV